MGKVIDIATMQAYSDPRWSVVERQEIYKEVIDRAYARLCQEDQIKITDSVYKMADAKIKNFGVSSAKEALMAIGILFASMSDQQFAELLLQRRARS